MKTRSSFDQALLEALRKRVSALGPAIKLPVVSHFELPPAVEQTKHAAAPRRNNFGALVLADGTVGMTYIALDDALDGLRSSVGATSAQRWQGADVMTLADNYIADTGWERALGLAAVNAVSQWLLARSGDMTPAPSTLPMLNLRSGDQVGMVGHFGRLLDPIRAAGASLTVIELDASLVREESSLVVTLDHRRLETCNKIIITGTTLLNQTLDDVLSHCQQAEQVNLLGPSASCIGEPLFERGVTSIGGFHVHDTPGFLAAWRAGQGWRDAGIRYCLTNDA